MPVSKPVSRLGKINDHCSRFRSNAWCLTVLYYYEKYRFRHESAANVEKLRQVTVNTRIDLWSNSDSSHVSPLIFTGGQMFQNMAIAVVFEAVWFRNESKI